MSNHAFLFVPGSLSQSMSSFVSQNACAGKEDRAKKAMFTGMGIGVIAGIIMFGIILLAGKNLCGLFSTNQPVINLRRKSHTLACGMKAAFL
ncbi:MAG: MATE family efflux transporter [Erysipelotrichaceae bacterium]|nr:MATE family efflux transporter [Erysipelotrichaceae bacterium]